MSPLYDEWADAAIPGLEAFYELSRNGKSVVLNDFSRPERYELEAIDGLFDTTNTRESREPRPDDHGVDRGRQLSDEKVVAFSGRTFAGSFAKLRAMQTLLSSIAGVEPQSAPDSKLRIIPIDYYARRNYGTSYWRNWLKNPEFALDLYDWEHAAARGVAPSSFTRRAAYGTAGDPFHISSSERYSYSPWCARIVTPTMSSGQRCAVHPWSTSGITYRTGAGAAQGGLIPIKPRSTWTATGLFSLSSLAGTPRAFVAFVFYSATREVSGGTFSGNLLTTAGVGRSTITAQAPAGARYMEMLLIVDAQAAATSVTLDATDLMLLEGSSARHTINRYVPGCRRAPINSMAPAVFTEGHRPHNLFTNPIAGSGAVGPTGGATVTKEASSGSVDARIAAARVAPDGGVDSYQYDIGAGPALILEQSSSGTMGVRPSSRREPAVEGVIYSFSAIVRPNTTVRQARARVNFYDNTGASISQLNSTFLTQVLDEGLALYFEALAPAGTFLAQCVFEINNTVTNEVHIVSNPRMCVGSHDGQIRHGDYPGWEWMGTRGDSGSQQKFPQSYVLEDIDVDVKQQEKQDSRERKRPFLLTVKARDPRVYSEYSEELVISPVGTMPAYVAEANPGTFAGTTDTVIQTSDEAATGWTVSAGIIMTDADTYVQAPAPGNDIKVVPRVPNAAVAGSSRYAMIHVAFNRFGKTNNYGEYAGFVFKRTSSNTRYELRFPETGVPRLYKWVGGVQTTPVNGVNGYYSPTLDYGYMEAPRQEFWAKIWVTNDNTTIPLPGWQASSDILHVQIFYTRPTPFSIPDAEFTSIGGGFYAEAGLYDAAAGKFGWLLSNNSIFPVAVSQRFRLISYEEGEVVSPSSLTGTAFVDGDIDTPPTFKITGPVAYPTIAVDDDIVVFTDLVLSTGDVVTIHPNAMIEGAPIAVSEKNLLTGTILNNLKAGSRQVSFGGQGMVEGQTRLQMTWRAARK